MDGLLLTWTYWLPILVSIGILLLYSILSEGRWAFATLLAGEVIALGYFLFLPENEVIVLPTIAMTCAVDRLIAGRKESSWVERAACIVFILLLIVVCGRAGVFVFMLFQFLLSAIYILPRRKCRQDGKLKCFSLWIAQFIVLALLVLPTVNFRVSHLFSSEASVGVIIILMPVIAVFPVALWDVLLPE